MTPYHKLYPEHLRMMEEQNHPTVSGRIVCVMILILTHAAVGTLCYWKGEKVIAKDCMEIFNPVVKHRKAK